MKKLGIPLVFLNQRRRIPGEKSSTGNWESLKTPLIHNREEGSSEHLEKENILPVCGSANLVRTLLLCFLVSVTRLAS